MDPDIASGERWLVYVSSVAGACKFLSNYVWKLLSFKAMQRRVAKIPAAPSEIGVIKETTNGKARPSPIPPTFPSPSSILRLLLLPYRQWWRYGSCLKGKAIPLALLFRCLGALGWFHLEGIPMPHASQRDGTWVDFCRSHALPNRRT